MSTLIGIGFSQNPELRMAVKEACDRARRSFSDTRPHLTFVATTYHYDPVQVLQSVNESFDHSEIIGCSTPGLIIAGSTRKRGIAILLISSNDMKLGKACVPYDDRKDYHKMGIELSRRVLANLDESSRQIFLFLLNDPTPVTEPLLKGFQETLGNLFPIIGGNVTSHLTQKSSYLYFEDQIVTKGITGLLIGGHTSIGVGARHGWRPLGKPRIIDRARQNIIQTINGKPAVSLYSEYFSRDFSSLDTRDHNTISMLYPLGIMLENSREYLIRNPVKILSDGSIQCQGSVLEGAEVHVMIGNKGSCLLSAEVAAQDALKGLMGKTPKLILVIESETRMKILGRSAHEEIEKVQKVFGPSVPIVGFYTNGEFYPFKTEGRFEKPQHQNESITVLAMA